MAFRRVATALVLSLQLVLATRGFAWAPSDGPSPAADAHPAARTASVDRSSGVTGAAHRSHTAPRIDGTAADENIRDEAPSDEPCHEPAACHAGAPCCGPVLVPGNITAPTAHRIVVVDMPVAQSTAVLVTRTARLLPPSTAPPARS